jgi:hypothetical protein
MAHRLTQRGLRPRPKKGRRVEGGKLRKRLLKYPLENTHHAQLEAVGKINPCKKNKIFTFSGTDQQFAFWCYENLFSF